MEYGGTLSGCGDVARLGWWRHAADHGGAGALALLNGTGAQTRQGVGAVLPC